jgi:hypothetical protein
MMVEMRDNTFINASNIDDGLDEDDAWLLTAGGAMAFLDIPTVTVSLQGNSTVFANKAKYGAGMFFYNIGHATVQLAGSVHLYDNKAHEGGVIYVENAQSFSLDANGDDVQMNHNTANASGPGLFLLNVTQVSCAAAAHPCLICALPRSPINV